MIRLTPFAETNSGKALIKNERVAIIVAQVQEKFVLADARTEVLHANVQKLELEDLKLLILQILHFDTLEALEQWIAARLLSKPA